MVDHVFQVKCGLSPEFAACPGLDGATFATTIQLNVVMELALLLQFDSSPVVYNAFCNFRKKPLYLQFVSMNGSPELVLSSIAKQVALCCFTLLCFA